MKYYCVVFDELCRRKGVTANAVRNMNKPAAYFGVRIVEFIGLAPLPEEK